MPSPLRQRGAGKGMKWEHPAPNFNVRLGHPWPLEIQMKKNFLFMILAVVLTAMANLAPCFAQGPVIQRFSVETVRTERADLADTNHDRQNASDPTCKWNVEARGTWVRYPDGSGTAFEANRMVRFDIDSATENANRYMRFASGAQVETVMTSEAGNHLTTFLQFRSQGFSADTFVVGWRAYGTRTLQAQSVLQTGWFLDRATNQYWPVLFETYRTGGLRVGPIGWEGPIYSVTLDGRIIPADPNQICPDFFRHLMVPTQFSQGNGYESSKYWFSVPEWAEGQKGEWVIRQIHSPSSPEVQINFGPNVVFVPQQ